MPELLSLLSDEDGIFEEVEGEEWDSPPHLSIRPGILPAIETYQLLLGVVGPSVGGDDMTERVALRNAISCRADFLAQAMAAVGMSLGDMYTSWRKACELPALEGCESDESESGDESDSNPSNKRQKKSLTKNTPPDFLKVS